MNGLGLIARADDGGLGTQAWELARHLRPERVLVVALPEPRGRFHLDRYTNLGYEPGVDLRVTCNPIPDADAAWLCGPCDRVIAPETFYLDDRVMAAGVGPRLLLLVNPELFVPSYQALANQGVIEVFAPTDWETDRLGRHTVLPQPVARDVIHHERRTGPATTFLHVSGPAMLDRNGTTLVRSACNVYDGPPITLRVSGLLAPSEPWRIGEVTVEPVGHVENYYDLWTADIDVFLQPRRYGGLNMLQLEAAAAGIPTICIDRKPECNWGGSILVAPSGSRPQRMKGGMFPVYDADPLDIAQQMAWCARNPLTHYSAKADEWAHTLSWETLLPLYHTTLA